MVVNQQALGQLHVGFKTLFNKQFAATSTSYEKVATVVPSTTGIEEYGWLDDLPGMREWIGSRVVRELKANGYLIKNKDFELTVSVPRPAIEDDRYGIYGPRFSAMGEAAKRHPDELVYGLLKKGFEEKCFDGKPFFSASHKVAKKNVSNLGEAALSMESYAVARTGMMSLVNDEGTPLGIVPDLLVVPPALEKKALDILNTEMINGSTNPYKGTAELLVEPQLAGKDTEWYLLCTNKFMKPLIYQERKKAEFTEKTKLTDDNVFFENEFIWGADSRGNAGFGFWQLAFGSKGTS